MSFYGFVFRIIFSFYFMNVFDKVCNLLLFPIYVKCLSSISLGDVYHTFDITITSVSVACLFVST